MDKYPAAFPISSILFSRKMAAVVIRLMIIGPANLLIATGIPGMIIQKTNTDAPTALPPISRKRVSVLTEKQRDEMRRNTWGNVHQIQEGGGREGERMREPNLPGPSEETLTFQQPDFFFILRLIQLDS